MKIDQEQQASMLKHTNPNKLILKIFFFFFKEYLSVEERGCVGERGSRRRMEGGISGGEGGVLVGSGRCSDGFGSQRRRKRAGVDINVCRRDWHWHWLPNHGIHSRLPPSDGHSALQFPLFQETQSDIAA